MKKRFLGFFLAAVLLLTLPVLAVQDSSGPFLRQKTYTGQFSDLTADSVFYENVSALYEYGLSVGKADGTFGMQDSVTVGQAVIFTARLRSLYRYGDPEQGPEQHAAAGTGYAPYIAYLKEEGILGEELEGRYQKTALRAEAAGLLGRALPFSDSERINETTVRAGLRSGDYLTDVTDETPFAQEIRLLYQTGIAVGSDARGTFHPMAPIRRGALAALLTRTVDPALRLTLDWPISGWKSAVGTRYGDLVVPGPYVPAPATLEELDGDIREMLAQERCELHLHYQRMLPREDVNTVMDQALQLVKRYPEQSYNQVNCIYDDAGNVDLTFAATSVKGETERCREFTLEAAIAVHDQLWREGTLNPSLSEKEIAQVYYHWICRHGTYAYGEEGNVLLHLPYSLFAEGRAVCDGYTGAYNLLLKLEGIRCRGFFNQVHIWTLAELDGTEYHIDTTWGDGNDGKPDLSYFAMTPQQSWNRHSW